ncbi:MAG: hypothetical protein ABIH59_00555 [archaeon]
MPKMNKTKNQRFLVYLNNRNHLNKKADVTVMILVLGVFAICVFAILSFIIGSSKTQDSLNGVEIVEEVNSKIDQYYFYKESVGFSEIEILDILKMQTDDKNKNFINVSKIINGKQIYVTYYP